MQILVVDDDQSVRDSLQRSLQYHGYQVTRRRERRAGPGPAGRPPTRRGDHGRDDAPARRAGSDPDAAGRRQRRPHPAAHRPGAVNDRVDGLDAGGDDYLAKQFALDELLARVRALVRRAGPTTADSHDPSTQALTFSDLVLNTQTREVLRGTRTITLTRTEFALLETFMHHPRRLLERSWLRYQVWGIDFPTSPNSLEVYIGYLRRKTEASGEPRLLHTHRGIGYVLRETPVSSATM